MAKNFRKRYGKKRFGRKFKRRMNRGYKKFSKKYRPFKKNYSKKRFSKKYGKKFKKGRHRRAISLSSLKVTKNGFFAVPSVIGVYNTKTLTNKDSHSVDGKNRNPGIYESLFDNVPEKVFSDRNLDTMFDYGVHNINILLYKNEVRVFNPDKSRAPGFRFSMYKPLMFSYKSFCALGEVLASSRYEIPSILSPWFIGIPVLYCSYGINENKPNIVFKSLLDILAENVVVDFSYDRLDERFQQVNRALGQLWFRRMIEDIILQRWFAKGGQQSLSSGCVVIIRNGMDISTGWYNSNITSFFKEDGTPKEWKANNTPIAFDGSDIRGEYVYAALDLCHQARTTTNQASAGLPADKTQTATYVNNVTFATLSTVVLNSSVFGVRRNTEILAPIQDIVNVNAMIRDMSIYTICSSMTDVQRTHFVKFISNMLLKSMATPEREPMLHVYLNSYFTPGARDNLLYEDLEALTKLKILKVKKLVNDKVYRYKPKGGSNLAYFTTSSGTTVDHTLNYGFDKKTLKEKVYDIIKHGDKSLVDPQMMDFLNRQALVSKLVVK